MKVNRAKKILLLAFVVILITFGGSSNPVTEAQTSTLYPTLTLNQIDGGEAVQSIVNADVFVTITDYDPETNKIHLHAHFDYRNAEGLLRDFDASSKPEVSNFEFNWEDKLRGTCTEIETAKIECAGFISRIIVSYDYTQIVGQDPFDVGAGINVPDAEIIGNVSLGFLSRLYYVDSNPLEPTSKGLGYLEWQGTGNGAFGSYATFKLSKPWTLMYYFATDTDLSSAAAETGLQEASKNENVNIVYFRDPNGLLKKTKYDAFEYVSTVLKDNQVDVAWETNSGDPQTLIDFIDWSQRNFPADHFALIIYGHAHGVAGIGNDENPGLLAGDGECVTGTKISQHCLNFGEIGDVLSNHVSQKVEVIYLAGCSSATAEAAYQLRNSADFMVASQQLALMGLVTHKGYIYSNQAPIIDSTTTAYDLSIGMAQDYVSTLNQSYSDNYVSPAPYTMSVIDLSKIEQVEMATHQLANALLGQMPTIAPTIGDILTNVQSFSEYTEHNDYYLTPGEEPFIDLFDFAELVKSNVDDTSIDAFADEIMQLIGVTPQQTALVVFEAHQTGNPQDVAKYRWELDDSHGISIYFAKNCAAFYDVYWLDFAKGADWRCATNLNGQPNLVNAVSSDWAGLVSEYVIYTDPNAPVVQDPPPLMAPPFSYFEVFLPVTLNNSTN